MGDSSAQPSYGRAMRLTMLLLLAACTGEANHLAVNPASLVTTAVDNAAYAARRTQVKTYLQANAQAVADEDPGTLTALWDIARTPPNARAAVLRELRQIERGPGWSEYATVVVMVHS